MTGRWSALDLNLVPMGEGREIASSEFSGAAAVVSTADADVLSACRRFRTLAEHAAEHRAENALEILQRAAAAGLLIPASACHETSRKIRGKVPPIAALGVVTRDRPELLARCLAGYRAPEIIVCDDGDRRPPLPPGLRYAGAVEKAAFLDVLSAESGVPRALAAFALGDTGVEGFRAGGNRNALFFDCVDRLFLSVDDDTVGRLFLPPRRDPGVALGSEGPPFEAWSYPDRESALASASPAEVDFLSAHAALLGRAPAEFPDLDASRVELPLFRRLARGRARTALTMTGLIGDCAVSSSSWLHSLDRTSVARLAGSDAAWEISRRSREVLRAAARPVFSDQPSFLSYAFGADGRALLPPFPPFGRNGDAVFVFALLRCLPDALIGHLPLAVLHAPGEVRRYPPATPGRSGFGDILVTCMAGFEPSPGKSTSDAVYRSLGAHLRELAALPDADHDDVLRSLLWQRASGRLDRLEQERAENPGCPERALDLGRFIEGFQAALLKPEFTLTKDVPGADPAARRALAKTLLGRYGDLLEAWPALVAAARRLAARGVRVSVPV